MSENAGGADETGGSEITPDIDDPACSHDDFRSSMLPPTVKYNEPGDPVATRSASPSAAAETRTSEPSAATERAHERLGAAVQRRDPSRYQIINEHGRGGIGRVSRAHDRDLGRDVAIKELFSRSNLSEARFLREALITARLEHPGIVPVHEAGRWPDGTPFYAMKLVSGRPLRDLIAARTTIEERLKLLHHVIAVADAIAYAHGRNIIHRDLKPGNVIVGDFGETIVIDWGLAKDISVTDEFAVVDGPFRVIHDDILTSAGSVLGTPAYMAPEQERGEHVDQRADVFAIGAMLWELCALQKVPPTERGHRHRMLRSSGIDSDLVAIIDKALARDPLQRYPHAGALAADLNAFKSGARIAARSYSLFAMLAHWTRRNRTLALSMSVAIALVAISSVFYLRSVATERDRANSSEERARLSQSAAESSLEALTLKHAQLLLITDPSAAVDALSEYRGGDHVRADQIRAEAHGRGVAILRAMPHTNNVLWTESTPDGAIISLSNDGKISRTSFTGITTVIAVNVAQIGRSAYSSDRHLLAYACDPSDICLFDVLHSKPIPLVSLLRSAQAVDISFSPDGKLLAFMSSKGSLSVIDLSEPLHPMLRLSKAIDHGVSVKFLDDSVVAAGTVSGLVFVHIATRGSEPVVVSESTVWDADPRLHEFVLATAQGQVTIFTAFPLRVVAHEKLCYGPIASVRFIPGEQKIAYACRKGTIGIWDLQRKQVIPRVQLESHVDMIVVSPTGDYILAAGGNGTLVVLDLTVDLVTYYKGHGFRLTSITPPSSGHSFAISGDVKGAVRVWPLPARLVRIVANSNSRFQAALFDNTSHSIVATSWSPTLKRISTSSEIREIGPHERGNITLEQSDSGTMFASYGTGDIVELWGFATMSRIRTINTSHGSVSRLRFTKDADNFITSGSDGKLIQWTTSGEPTLLVQFAQSIEDFVQIDKTKTILFSSIDGALWRAGQDGSIALLRAGGVTITQLCVPPHRSTAYVGYANGEVVAIDTRSWKQTTILHLPGAVYQMVSSRNGQLFAIVSHDGTVSLGSVGEESLDRIPATWTTFTIRARYVTLASDGLLVAASTDGLVWLYRSIDERLLCLPIGTVDLTRLTVDDAGDAAAILDSEGHLMLMDLERAQRSVAPN